MAGPGKKNFDDALVLNLAAGLRVPDAAKKARCSERTARRRLADPEFRSKVETTRASMVQDAVGRLAASGRLAVKTLRQLAKSGETDTVRLGAAKALVDFMFRGHELGTLAAQVAELQRQLEEMKNGPGNDSERSEPASEHGEAATSSEAALSSTQGESVAPDARGGHDTGPVAGARSAVNLSAGVAPLFPPGR
jgi:hypothetical protein